MIFRTNGVKCGKVAACGIYKRKAPHLDELLAVWTGAEHPSINPLYFRYITVSNNTYPLRINLRLYFSKM